MQITNLFDVILRVVASEIQIVESNLKDKSLEKRGDFIEQICMQQ